MRAQANNGTAYDKQFAPPGTDFSPEEQKQREVDRYVQGRWGEQGLSTQGAAELGIGAQYTAPQNQYSGPEGAGIPQVAVSRYSAAQAVVSAGMTQERATTLSQFPQLTAVLVNAGLMLPTNQEFPEGLPRAAVAAAQTGQSLISPQDVARLLNVTELDAAARKFLATDDPIRQRAIIASMSPLQQAAMMDMISVTGDRLKDFNSDTAMQAVNYVSTVLGYGFDVFWWLNRQAMHASRATIYGAQNDPLIAPQSMNPVTAPLAAAYSAVKYWDNTDIGNFDPGQMDSLRSQYGDLTIDVLSDLAVAEAKQQDEYAWNKNSVNWWFAGDGGVFPTFTPTSSETPLTTVMNKYKDNPEALDVIRRLVYLPAEDPAIVSAMHGVDAASNWNYGQLLLRYVPLDRQGDLQKNLAAGLNVAGTILNDPTLYAGTLIRSARLARYTLFKMAPGADIEKALSVPGVARKFNDAVAFIGRYKRLKDEEKAGTADLGSAEALRAAWARDNKDLENLIDPMMDWAGGRGVQSLDDVKTFIEEGNDLERIFSGRPAREASTVYETMMQSKANMARRDAMMPHYSAIGSLRSRTRQQLALNGLSARYGRKVSREMFGTARTPSEIADVVSSSAAAYGAKYGPVERPMSPVTAPVGAISKRRAGEAPVAGSVAVPFVEELNPGRFKYGVNSLGARWDRATRLLSKKPNGGLISVADGRDADKIYILARAFFPKHVAVVIKDAWLRGTVADRVRLHNGLVVSGGEVSGVRLRYGDAVGSALINDLAAGGSAAFERYSPTIVKRTRPDGGVTYKVFGQDSLENGAFPLSLRGPGEEFVSDAEAAAIGRQGRGDGSIALQEPPPPRTRVPEDAVPDPASGEFLVNPSDFNGRQHPLHLWQTTDYVRTPDYTEFERISQRAGFWSAMLGWSETELAKRVTDFWSFYTLVGPRFVARSALEDYTMWLMTDGSWTDLYKGRRAGTRLRAWRDQGVRLPNPEKFEGGQATYGKGPGSRLGFVNRRRKPRTETLRAAEETNNAYGRFILDHLMASERDELDKSRVALATALSEGNDVAARAARKTGREMLFRAFMRSRGIPLTSVNEFQSRILSRIGEDGSILQHLMDDVLEQSAYLNSVRVPSKAEEEMSSLGLAGITMGRTRTNTKTAYTNIFANGTSNSLEDAVGVTNSVFAATWYKQLVGAIKHDGPIGIIGIANLPKYANPRFTQDVIKQVADAIRRDTKWGYKERLAAFTESGVTPEEFAQRYLTDLFNLFSKKDGTLNYDLWRKVAVREKDTTVRERRTIGDQAEPPPTEPSPQEPPLTAAEMRNIPPEWRQVDFYEVLGVGRDASPDVIRRAYRKRLREVHPDVNDDPMASVLTQHVINAHDVLSNPVSRDLYDRATRRLMPTGDGTFVGSARVPDSVSITTEQSRLRVTDEYLDIADLSSMISKDPAEDMSPQWIVGTKEVPIPSPTELGHLDKMWQVLGAQYNRISKEPMFLANVLSESTKLEPYFKQLAAVIGEPAAEARVSKLVVDRATNLTLSYTDNPANRTLLAWKLRNLSRYYRATEDFVRRMMRVTKNYPEGIWKVALTYNAMDESGFVYTDNNGDKYFLYPGQGAALDITAGLMNQVFGFQSPDMQLFEVGGKVKMLMPSTDPAQYVQTLSGPMGVIPLAALATVMPQFDGLESALVGPYASNSNLFEQLVPAGIMRVLRMANPDARQALYASSFKSALQIAVAAGLEPKMNDVGSTDPKQTEEFKAAISNIAEVVLFGKLAFGFFDPASPQLIPADVTQYGRQLGMLSMNSEFRRMIDAQGDDPQAFENALVQFFSTYGGQAMPYTVSRSGTGEDYTGLLSVAETSSYTDQARAWVKDHQDVVDKFPVASTFLFPRDGKFDIKMYSWYRTEGYKSDKPDAEFYQDLMAAEGKFRYGQTQTYLQELQAAGQPYVFPDGTRAEVTDDFIKAQLDPIRKGTPFLDVVLSRGQYTSFIDSTERFLNGDASQQGEVRRMLDYYYSPDFTGEVPSAVAGIAEAVATFDYWKQQRDQVTGQRNADKEQRKAFEAALTYNLELVAQKDPNARVFVDQVLMPLATKNLYGPGADGISQVVPAAALAGR